MKKTKYLSVRLDTMRRISDKCYKATAFDGSSALIPASCVYGVDSERSTEAWWIAEWILLKRSLQFSRQKFMWA